MLGLMLRTLRLRKSGFIATFVAMFFGVVMVLACGGLMETGIRTTVPPQRLAAAPIVVNGAQTIDVPREDPAQHRPAGDEGKEGIETEAAELPEKVRLDTSMVDKLQAVPGVERVIGDVSFPAGDAFGHAWASAALTPYVLTEGSPPKHGEVIVENGQIGVTIPVPVHGSVENFRISGIAQPQHAVTHRAIFFSPEDADRLSGHPGSFDSIGVFAPLGTDISAVLGGAIALTGDDRGVAEFAEAEPSGTNLILISAVSGGMSILIAIFVVASTLALSIQQRQRELALLRAIGTTPRQLRRLIVGETLLVALLAVVAGVFVGTAFGPWLFDQLVTGKVVPAVLEYHQGFVPVAVAAGTAILAGLLGSLSAAHRAARIRPTEALAEATIQRKWLTSTRAVVAVLCFGMAAALSIVTVAVMTGPIAASTAGPAVVLWALGIAMITPWLARALLAILHWPLATLSGISGQLAVLNSRARIIRMTAAITPIMLATGVALGQIYLQTTQNAVADRAFTESLRADVVVSSQTGLDPSFLPKIRATNGVATATEFLSSQVWISKPFDSSSGDEGWPLLGVTGEGASQTTALTATSGEIEALQGNTIALPEKVASNLSLKVGDSMTVMLGDGHKTDVRVAAVISGKPGFENVVMPAALVAAHSSAGLPSQILVRAAPGVDDAQLKKRLAALSPAISVTDRSGLFAEHVRQQDINTWVNYLLVAMMVIYTVISVVNTLVAGTVRRRGEFGLQRLSGATRGQVMRMVLVEGLLVAAFGVILGTLAAAGAVIPFCLVANGSILPTGPLWIYLAVAGIGAVIALIATLPPAWAVTRGRPAAAALVGD